MRLADTDIDPVIHTSDRYLAEVYAIFQHDQDHLNSVGHQTLLIAGVPGGTWAFSQAGAGVVGPAITSWTGSRLSAAPPHIGPGSPDGRCLVAARATPNQDGTWHYEYAVYNHDMDRAARSFRLPLRPGATVTNLGFSAVQSDDGSAFTNDAWTGVAAAGAVEWSTGTAASGPANPLRWGTLYNFFFDSPTPPGSTRALIGMYMPASGQPDAVETVTTGPALCPADFDLRGTVTVQDLFDFLVAYFQADPRADLDGSGTVGMQDLFDYLIAFLTPC